MVKIRLQLQAFDKKLINPICAKDLVIQSLDNSNSIVAVKIDDQFASLDTIIHDESKVEFYDQKALNQLCSLVGIKLLVLAMKDYMPEALLGINSSEGEKFTVDFACSRSLTPTDILELERKISSFLSTLSQVSMKICSIREALQLFEQQGELFQLELLKKQNLNSLVVLLSYPKTIINTDVKYKLNQQINQSFKEEYWYQIAPSETQLLIMSVDPKLLEANIEKYQELLYEYYNFAGLQPVIKLLTVSSAYWQNQATNCSMQRMVGVCCLTQKDLDAYLQLQKDLQVWDHRYLGQKLDLWHLDAHNPGVIFWHPAGWNIFINLQKYLRKKLSSVGYKEVCTPVLLDSKLWKCSGHWDKFYENMFIIKDQIDKNNIQEFALKPMNCPAHIEIFKQGIKSYRDLPLRYSEFGSCHRNEPSGSLHGIMRVRNFVQDDAHIFCTEEQIFGEVANFCQLLTEIYNELGFEKIIVKFSDRPEKRVGDDDIWDLAESELKEAIEYLGMSYAINSGEGAFYGPKLEFVLQDQMHRQWQCGTLQLDFNLAKVLNATYINEHNESKHPIIIHRAILGSIERFIGILLEHYKGHLPVWLMPTQVVICTIITKEDSEVLSYAENLYQQLKSMDVQVQLDSSCNNINQKIKNHAQKFVPFILIIGRKELQKQTVAIWNHKIYSRDKIIDYLVKHTYFPGK